jgi:sporulation protein YlmC with PRC-barrel domain
MRTLFKTPVAIACVALSTSLVAQVRDPVQPQPGQPGYRDNTTRQETSNTDRYVAGEPTRLDKASGLIGAEVKNLEGEKLGDIKDVVIDFETGNVAYVVMSAGGLLGIGEKNLAVPLKAFTASADRSDSDAHLILRADKESINRAEGIGEQWPATRNPSFGAMPFWQEPEHRPGDTDLTDPQRNRDLTDPNKDRDVNDPNRPRQLEPQE